MNNSINLGGMTPSELETLKRNIAKELEMRKRQHEETLWKNVVDAINAYTENCGYIDIDTGESDTYQIYDTRGMEKPGEIIIY